MNNTDSEKQFPHSIEAEQSVLGTLIAYSDSIIRVIDILKPESFYRKAHQYIYTSILDLYNKSIAIDVITVSENLIDKNKLDVIGGRAYINDLALASMGSATIEYHAGIIAEKYNLRQLLKVSSAISEMASNEDESLNILSKAEKLLFDVANSTITSDLTHVKDFSIDIYNDIQLNYENKDKKIIGIPSGFDVMDILTGGFQPSDLIIVAARPAMGKTAFAVNIAQYAATEKNIPVAIFSLEMSRKQLGLRMFFSEAEINLGKYRTGNLTYENWSKINNAYGKVSKIPLYIDDKPFQTITEIRAKCKKLKMEQKDLGLIVIDYLQLIESEKEKTNRVDEVTKISRGLKGLAKELNVPVIALSQLSRACESRQDKRPNLSDLRESGSIEQDADIVMFIYRDEYYNETPENKGKAEIIISKQRNGAVGTVELLYQANITKFKNMLSA